MAETKDDSDDNGESLAPPSVEQSTIVLPDEEQAVEKSTASASGLSEHEVKRTRELLGILSNVSSTELGPLILRPKEKTEEKPRDDEEQDYVQPWFDASRLTRRAVKDYINGQDLLPDDTFSFFVSAQVQSIPFLVALLTMIFKFFTLLVVTLDVVDFSEGSTNRIKVPPGVTGAVRVGQILALILSILSAEGIAHSFRILRNGYSYPLLRREYPDVAEESDLILELRWTTSFWLRFSGECYAQVLTFILIMQATTILDVLLNYAAMSFISDIDNKVFALGRWKYWGAEVERHCSLVMLSDNPDAGPSCFSRFSHTICISVMFIICLIGWIWIVLRQDSGEYLCKTIRVRFEDAPNPSLGAFNGLYDRVQPGRFSIFGPKRVEYIERQSKLARFQYCRDRKAWVFRYNLNITDDLVNATTAFEEDFCNNVDAFSPETVSFDLLETTGSGWSALNRQGRAIPLTEDVFATECYDCGEQPFGNCRGGGKCVPDGGCECDPGRFGLTCELLEPCDSMNTDVRGGEFQSTRSWSSEYDLVRVLGDGTVVLGGDEGTILELYNRPMYAYVRGSREDIIFYTGRRWALTVAADLPNVKTIQDLSQFAQSFHAHYSSYSVDFLSEPVDIASANAMPVELQWFRAKEKTTTWGLQAADTTQPSEASLLCTTCNNETNPCFFNEFCAASGACQCSSSGSKGALCQVPPTANGHCDAKYNAYAFQRDGGDCCEQTCISGPYLCGRDESGYIYRGYPDCIGTDDIVAHKQTVNSSSVAISASGAVLAALDYDFYGNSVLLYDQDGSHWRQRGKPLTLPSWWTSEKFADSSGGFGRAVAVQSILPTARSNPSLRPEVVVVAGTFQLEAAFVVLCGSYGCKSDEAQVLTASPDFESYKFGYSVDMSNDATRVAVASFGSADIFESGYVRVWQANLANSTKAAYKPLGEPIIPRKPDNDANMTLHVLSVSLSGDGHVAAIVTGDDSNFSSIQTYEWKDDAWVLKGNPIIGNFCIEKDLVYPQLAALSFDGNTLAAIVGGVGAQAFDWSSDDGWIQKGETTINTFSIEACRMKETIALSGDGRIAAVGNFNDPSNAWMGIYEWKNDAWERVGQRNRKGVKSPRLSITSNGGTLAASMLESERTADEYNSGTTTIYSLPLSPCEETKRLLHVSFQAKKETKWSVVTETNGTLVIEGGPYTDFESSTVVEEICLDPNVCQLLMIGNANKYEIYWNGNKRKNQKNIKVGKCW